MQVSRLLRAGLAAIVILSLSVGAVSLATTAHACSDPPCRTR